MGLETTGRLEMERNLEFSLLQDYHTAFLILIAIAFPRI